MPEFNKHEKNKLTNDRLLISMFIENDQKIVLVIFVLIFIIGIFVFRDYGISWDEPHERQGTIIILKKIAATLGYPVSDTLKTIPDLDNYVYRFYGFTIQIPTSILEYIIMRGSSGSDTREVWLIRHFWVFLIYFISLICMYFLCKGLFRSKKFAILTVIMVFLYPRFFAESFYNIKDIMFSSLLQIALFANILFLTNNRHLPYAALAGFLTALAANSRFFALFLLVCVCLAMFLEDILCCHDVKSKSFMTVNKNGYIQYLLPYCVLLGVFLISFIMITPASWSKPIDFIYQYIKTFFGYDPWNDTVTFMGQNIIKNELPRYYFIVWLAISVPLIYLLYWLIGSFVLFRQALHDKKEIIKNQDILLVSVLFFAPFAATVLKKGLLYDWWRHLYFTFPMLVIIAVYGIIFIYRHCKSPIFKWVVFGTVAASLTAQAGWIVKNHPYQNVYLNFAGRQFGSQFDRDGWGLVTYQMLRWLDTSTPEKDIVKVASVSTPLYLMMLTEKQKEKIIGVEVEDAEYIISALRGIIGNDYQIKGFKEIHSVWVDGYKIGAIYKREG